jgi:FkbM family methyltransferase
MFYISKHLTDKRRFLDIGANVGIYSYYFRKKFNQVDAFEPLAEITYRLKSLESNKINVHNVALSDKKRKLKFYIPLMSGKPVTALASLEIRDCECEIREVDVDTVDSFGYSDVDLIKIDVEGHEEAVVMGAAKNN